MTRRILPTAAAFASLTLFSCYPYPEPPPRGPHSGGESVTSDEQAKIREQRERLKAAERERENNGGRDGNPGPTVEDGGGNRMPPPTTPKQNTTKPDYPFATSVPGKEGFVFSPYNQKVIDVREIQTGTLVQDPTYPAAEKKYFRVP